jgi:hypothetical protein
MSRVKLTLLVSIDTVDDRFTKEGSKTQKVEVDKKQSFALDGETIRSDLCLVMPASFYRANLGVG